MANGLQIVPSVFFLLQTGVALTGDGSFVEHLEPVFYDTRRLRSRRHLSEGWALDFRAGGRNFRLRLRQDDSVLSRNVTIDCDRHGTWNLPPTFSGVLAGERGSHVFGTVSERGIFEGEIVTRRRSYTLESSGLHFKTPQRFHSVLYSHEDVELNATTGFNSTCVADRLSTVLRGTVSAVGGRARVRERRDGTYGRRDRVYSSARYQPPQAEKTTCTLYMQADHLFFKRFNSDVQNVITQLIRHVQGLNRIYKEIDFDSDGLPDRISFIIQRIKIHTDEHVPGYKFKGNFRVENFLETFSEDNFDGYCLAYMFTYRDFEGGTLGLAWTGDLHNAGGVCEKNGQFRGSLKSLNSGIVTILNYGKDVPASVSFVTMAHEIGHNMGSQHDPESNKCAPGGTSGNYIMFARATSGLKRNNNRFSECSLASMNKVMATKARGESGCFIVHPIAVCGNEVVEEGEECDCGWADSCNESCCYPQLWRGHPSKRACRLTPGAICSASQGPCCRDCRLIAAEEGHVCRAAGKCTAETKCDGRSAACPAARNLPSNTICDVTRFCYNGVCNMSICQAFGLEECQCQLEQHFCHLCCKFPGVPNSCRSSFFWNEPGHSVPDRMSQPGSPCANYWGFCDVHNVCRKSKSDLDRESGVWSGAIVLDWMNHRWYAVLACVLSVLVLLAFIFKLVIVIRLARQKSCTEKLIHHKVSVGRPTPDRPLWRFLDCHEKPSPDRSFQYNSRSWL